MPESHRHISLLTKDTLALILAGGQGSRLMQLTSWRSKPAVPFGGKFRIIDFPLSNCLNSGIRRIGILSQYKSHSLLRHLSDGWSFLRGEFGEYIEILPASQRVDESWYAGTADAVYQNLDIMRHHDPKYVIVLGGDHVYKMDYGTMIAHHVKAGADMTVGCIEVSLEDAKGFGVLSLDKSSRITEFVEKPADPQPMIGRPDVALASMGIYIFNAAFLYEQLIRDASDTKSSHDFGKNIIPHAITRYRVIGHRFNDPDSGEQSYWRDIGTLDSYWAANMELIGVDPELDLYDRVWPIWTHQQQLPPAKFIFNEKDRCGMAIDSMVSGGCIVSGARVVHSLLFSNVFVNEGSKIEDSVILPEAKIGNNCRITKAIIDKGCVIADGTVIGEDPKVDAERFHVSDQGVVLVTPEMLGQDLHRGI